MRRFPSRVCINLDRRPDRWGRMQQEFTRHGIDGVRRFSAIDGNALDVPSHWPESQGAYGCLLSHLQVVRDARARGLPSVLIFEDDVAFDPEFRLKVDAYCEELPSDWDMVFLGAFHRDDPVPVSEHLGRIIRAHSTYAYALNHSIYDAFIDSNNRARLAVDENNLNLQAQFDCYAFIPNLAWVEPLYSDTQEWMCNHWYLRESLVLRGRLISELITKTLMVIAYENRTGNSLVEDNLAPFTSSQPSAPSRNGDHSGRAGPDSDHRSRGVAWIGALYLVTLGRTAESRCLL